MFFRIFKHSVENFFLDSASTAEILPARFQDQFQVIAYFRINQLLSEKVNSGRRMISPPFKADS